MGTDLLALGHQVRHLRRASGRTLEQLGDAVGVSASSLSLIENGKREPKLSTLSALAQALGVEVSDLLTGPPPSRRAALELELETVQRADSFAALGVPAVKPGPRVPTPVLEALTALHQALAEALTRDVATPEYARRANADLRTRMRAQDNYFPDIEDVAAGLLNGSGYTGGPMTRAAVERLIAHAGFRLVPVRDLPRSTRTVTDLEGKRIFVPFRRRDGSRPGPSRCRPSGTSCSATACPPTTRSSWPNGWRSTTSLRRCSCRKPQR